MSCFFVTIGVNLLASAQGRRWAPRTSPFSLGARLKSIQGRGSARVGTRTCRSGRHAIHIAPPASGHQTGTQTIRTVLLKKPVVGAHVDGAEGHSATCPFSQVRESQLLAVRNVSNSTSAITSLGVCPQQPLHELYATLHRPRAPPLCRRAAVSSAHFIQR